MNKYVELKKRQSEEINTLPMKVAFGDKQFERMIKEWGLITSERDLKKICSLGYGAYCLVSDVHLFKEMENKHSEELEEFMKSDEGLKDAFMYEFANHECGYIFNPEDAIATLGLTMTEIKASERLNKVFEEAWNEYIVKCE